MAETRVDGNLVIADGAAFESGRRWYGLRFRCRATADHARIQAFEYAVGDAIPPPQWEGHGLSSSHGAHNDD